MESIFNILIDFVFAELFALFCCLQSVTNYDNTDHVKGDCNVGQNTEYPNISQFSLVPSLNAETEPQTLPRFLPNPFTFILY